MSRDLTSGTATAAAASPQNPVLIAKVQFVSTTLRLWTGYGDLAFDSSTYLGNGWLLGISDVEEDGEIKADSVDLILSGVPLSLVSLLLDEASYSTVGTIWFGFLNSSGALIADPYMVFRGTLSAPRVDDSSDASQIVLTFEDELIMLQHAPDLRANRESQQAFYPDDLGFDYVIAGTNWDGFWGNKEKPNLVAAAKRRRTTKNRGRRR